MTKYHILVATDLTDESMQILKTADDVALQVVAPSLPAIRSELHNAHAVIARDDVLLDKSLLQEAGNLVVVGRVGAALSGIDIETATGQGVIVMNTPGTSAIAAGEHTLTLMLALSR